MSTLSGGPGIVTDGLVLYLDAANVKSLTDVPATNLLTWSEQFEDASWVKTRSTVISNITNSPINTLTGDKLIDNTESNNHQFGKLTTAPINSPIIGSIYVKKSDYNNIVLRITDNAANINGTISSYQANFNIVNGTITFQNSFNGTALNPIATITQDKDGWFRCSIGLTKRADATRTDFQVFLFNRDGFFDNPTFIGTGDKGNFVWGAQLETGTVATAYIPTTSTAASRVPIWKDISRGGKNATLINGPTYNPANGGSLVFDGIDDYVNLGSTVDNSLTWTMSSWFYMLTNTTDSRSLIGNSGTSPAGAGRFMGVNSDNSNPSRYRKPWVILYNSSGVQSQIFGNTTILGNTWYNITTTHTGTTALVYVNGVVDQTPLNVDGYLPSNNILTIGLLRASYWPFPGNIAMTQLYNRALTAQEVLQNYNAQKSRFGI